MRSLTLGVLGGIAAGWGPGRAVLGHRRDEANDYGSIVSYPSSDNPSAQPPVDPYGTPPGYTLPPTSGGEHESSGGLNGGIAGGMPQQQVEYPIVPPPAQQPYQAPMPPADQYPQMPSGAPYQAPYQAPYPGPGAGTYQPQSYAGTPQSTPPFGGVPQSTPPFQAQPMAGYPMQPPPPGPWQQPVVPPQPPRSRSPLPWVIGGIAVFVVLCLVGMVIFVINARNSGGGGGGKPTVAASNSPTGEPGPSGTGAPHRSGGLYTPIENVCPTIDLAPLGAWSATKEGDSKRTSEIDSLYSEVSCEYDLRSSTGVKITLDITIQIFEELDDAESDFQSSMSFDKSMYFDTTISGIGDEAYGNSRDWDLGLKVSTYEVILRSANLMVSTDVTTFADAYVPKAEIKDKALAQTRSVLDLYA